MRGFGWRKRRKTLLFDCVGWIVAIFGGRFFGGRKFFVGALGMTKLILGLGLVGRLAG